jgi:hypothetical protein
MDYTELKLAIEQYAENFEDTFVQNVDTFIQLAESRLMLRVRLPNFRKDNLSLTATAHSNQLTVPPDFLSPDSLIAIGPTGLTPLLNKDSEFIDEMYPDPKQEGPLRFYCYLNELTIRLGPTPDLPYPMRLGYFFQPPSIVTTGTSWLGDHFAHALISGSLVKAAIYMKSEDEMFQRYKLMWDSDIQMDLEHAKGRTKKDTYQEPDVRVPA